MRFKLVEDVDKLGALDKLDNLFGQSDVYMWSTYILPNGHFLNPDNSSDYWEEIDSDPEYEHSDFIYNNYNPYGEDLFDDCIKMNVTYPYLILPENRPTPEQYQAIKSIIDSKDGFHYALSDIEDRLGRDLGHMGEPLLVQTPFADTVFDLSKVDKYDIVKAINKAYLTKSFLNESKVRKDLIDLTNRKFGDLTVIEYDKEKSRKTGQTYWKCKCSCGNETVVSRKHLLNGDIKSCGHTKRQNGLDHYEDNFKGMRDRQNKYHTNLEIIRNQKMQPNNTSGVKGVDYHKGRDMWRARVRVNGKELTKWSKDKDVAIKWRQDAIDKYYKPQIDKAIKAGDLKEDIIYRGSGNNGLSIPIYLSHYTGKFYTTNEDYASLYGDVSTYDLDSKLKIYKTTKSSSACGELDLTDYKCSSLKDFTRKYIKDNLHNEDSSFYDFEMFEEYPYFEYLSQWYGCYEDYFGEDFDYDPELESFSEWCQQIVLKDYLKNKGYDGIYYSEEDGEEQYQIWGNIE